MVGDSLTARGYYLGTDGNGAAAATGLSFADRINAPFLKTIPVRNVASTGGIRVVANPATTRRIPVPTTALQCTFINSGVSGNIIHDIEIAVASRITSHNPNCVVIDCTISDGDGAANGGIETDPTAYQASYQSVITQTRAAIPGVPIVIVDALCAGELWTNTTNPPTFFGNVGNHDAKIDALCAINRTLAITNNCEHVPMREAAAFWESQNNPNNDLWGHLTRTGDGIHQTADPGAVFMGNQLMKVFRVTPEFQNA